MPIYKLNNTIIQNLKPTIGKQVDYFDKLLPGFGVRVSPKGTKTFFVQYRYQNKLRRLTLGRCDVIGLAVARQHAKACKTQLAQNKDPWLERNRAVKPAQLPFGRLVEQFIEKHARVRTKSWKETQRVLQRDFVKAWGERDATAIDKHDVNALIDSIAKDYPGAANHAFAHIRKLFNWAVQRGHLERSPCVGMSAPAPNRPRERVLKDTEITAVWEAATSIGYPYGPMILLLILTAQRRSEVSEMEWGEIAFQERLWTIPSARTKNARTTVVPLSPLAIEILGTLPRRHDRLVFPSQTGLTPVSGFSKWKRDLDQRSGVTGWELRDLRRTTATGLAALRTPIHIIERCLNHTLGGLTPIASVYNRFDYLEEKRSAFDLWAEKITALIQKDAETPLPNPLFLPKDN